MDSRKIGTIGTILSVCGGIAAGVAALVGSKENAERTAENQRAFESTLNECRQATAECRQTTADCRDFMSRWSTPSSGGGYGSSIAPR